MSSKCDEYRHRIDGTVDGFNTFPHWYSMRHSRFSFFLYLIAFGNPILFLFFSFTHFLRFADKHQFGHLHTINENHMDMLELFDAIRKIVAANEMGPTIYLYPIYLYYSSLLSDQIRAMTERIFQQTVIPNLPVNISLTRWRLSHPTPPNKIDFVQRLAREKYKK